MPAHYTYKFGSLGQTLQTAAQTEFFGWFNLEPTERRIEPPGAVVRYRPSGSSFRGLCSLDATISPADELVRLELSLDRSFVDGPDGLFAQDLVKSFLLAALPDACKDSMPDFLAEICEPGGDGRSPGYLVFRGRKRSWRFQTGWSRLCLCNTTSADVATLIVRLMPSPEAPNAKLVGDPQKKRIWDSLRFMRFSRLFGSES
jgi:hypothetical protein